MKTSIFLNGDYTIKRLKEIIEKYEKENKEEEEKPILIGYLARKSGYNGYHTLEVGTPIYSHKNMYFMDMIKESDGSTKRQYYYVRSFKDEDINFIVRETKKEL
jgi:hypothetical protein